MEFLTCPMIPSSTAPLLSTAGEVGSILRGECVTGDQAQIGPKGMLTIAMNESIIGPNHCGWTPIKINRGRTCTKGVPQPSQAVLLLLGPFMFVMPNSTRSPHQSIQPITAPELRGGRIDEARRLVR